MREAGLADRHIVILETRRVARFAARMVLALKVLACLPLFFFFLPNTMVGMLLTIIGWSKHQLPFFGFGTALAFGGFVGIMGLIISLICDPRQVSYSTAFSNCILFALGVGTALTAYMVAFTIHLHIAGDFWFRHNLEDYFDLFLILWLLIGICEIWKWLCGRHAMGPTP